MSRSDVYAGYVCHPELGPHLHNPVRRVFDPERFRRAQEAFRKGRDAMVDFLNEGIEDSGALANELNREVLAAIWLDASVFNEDGMRLPPAEGDAFDDEPPV